MKHEVTSRSLLKDIGVSDMNATMIIPYMMIAPATTDPKSGQIIVLVSRLQQLLYALGATDVRISGYLDEPTAAALEQVAGPDWERMTWGANVEAALRFQQMGRRIRSSTQAVIAPSSQPIAVSGTFDFLPDVPGGLFTYGAAAYLTYLWLSKRRRK